MDVKDGLSYTNLRTKLSCHNHKLLMGLKSCVTGTSAKTGYNQRLMLNQSFNSINSWGFMRHNRHVG